MDNQKTLIVVAGPTAAGKTAAAIQLAQHYRTGIISTDSRQFYKEMSIGTAKPSQEELTAARHYLVGSHSVTENFTVGDFEQEGLRLLGQIFKSHDIAILAGGSGLYIKAICEGFDELPVADEGIRERLNKEFAQAGIGILQDRLKKVDPVYFDQVDRNNPQRLIRALEVFETTGKPFSSYRTATKQQRPFRIIKIGLTPPREVLYERINVRVDQMIRDGLIDEVKSLLPYRHLNALQTVGYSELFDYFDGKTDLLTAIELIKQHTRQFAKRQMTWFNKDKQIIWVDPLKDNVIALSQELLNANPEA